MSKILLICFMSMFSLSVLANSAVNQALLKLYKEDQTDRQNNSITWAKDDARLASVERIIASDGLVTTEDYYHAAVIFQHGRESKYYLKAKRLALKSVELNNNKARWLASAAEDRYLHSVGKPQIWGTQFNGIRCLTMEPFDRTIKTDTQRVANGVPTLAQIEDYLKAINQCEE